MKEQPQTPGGIPAEWLLDEDDARVVHPDHEAKLLQDFGPDLRAIRTVAGVVVMRKVARQVFAEYKAKLFTEKTRPTAGDWLARQSCVWPDQRALGTMIDQFPGITTKMVKVAGELVGSDEDAPEKKLGTR